MLKISFTIFSFLLISCCSTIKKSDISTVNNHVNELEGVQKEMIEAGYSKGIMSYSEMEADCSYTIKVEEGSSIFLDPINLDESFMIDQEKIWFTYKPLKMKNRCDMANPISLIDIQLRKE